MDNNGNNNSATGDSPMPAPPVSNQPMQGPAQPDPGMGGGMATPVPTAPPVGDAGMGQPTTPVGDQGGTGELPQAPTPAQEAPASEGKNNTGGTGMGGGM